MNAQLKQFVLCKKNKGESTNMNFTNTQFKTADTQFILVLRINTQSGEDLKIDSLNFSCFTVINCSTKMPNF